MFIINNVEWNIKFVPPLHPMLYRSDGSVTVGMCDNETRTIYIDSTLNGKFLKKVLCHELTHAAMFSYGIELSIEQEELLADLIATYGEEIILITNKILKKLKEK